MNTHYHYNHVPIKYANFLEALPTNVVDIVNSYNSTHREQTRKIFAHINKFRCCLLCNNTLVHMNSINLKSGRYFCSNKCQQKQRENDEKEKRDFMRGVW